MAGRLVNDAGAAVPSSDFRVPRYGGADDRSIQCALSRSGGRGAGGRGPPPPLSEPVAQEYATHSVRLTAVYSNCSGKHAGMLALARHHDWPTQFYTRLEHPVQQRCLAEVSRWTDVPAGAIKTAVDGCGVVCFGLPLRNMALAYARLANAEVGTRNAEQPGEVARAATSANLFRVSRFAFRIVEAMLRHPELIAGSGRPCTELMRAHPGRVIAKVGAERSEEHTSELQSPCNLVCRLLLEKKK